MKKLLLYALTFVISPSYAQKSTNTRNLLNDTSIYDAGASCCELLPEPKGGTVALLKYIADSTRYPSGAVEDRAQGRVIVCFVVEIDGGLSNFKIKKGVRADLDQEAIRLIRQGPKWKPGMQNGLPVRVRLVMPITFYLRE